MDFYLSFLPYYIRLRLRSRIRNNRLFPL